jgi:hypothetical protein
MEMEIGIASKSEKSSYTTIPWLGMIVRSMNVKGRFKNFYLTELDFSFLQNA